MTFKRVTIAIQTGSGSQNVDAYHLHDSSWAVVKSDRPSGQRVGGPWMVYHVPTGLLIRQGIESMRAAKDLAVTVRDAHPVLPALAALPFGTGPSAETPEAKAEAVAILATINAWVRNRAVFG